MVSAAKDTHTTNRVIRVPDGLWEAYRRVCTRRGLTLTEDLLKHMQAEVNRYGDEKDLNDVATAMEDMAQRRSRKGGHSPKEPAAD